MTRKVTKAIFPVAGLGTRFLPATKSVPKEIMTLVDKPLVQYAIDEAREAGIEEFIFVTSRGKGALEDYFDCSPQLEASLEEAGKTELLNILRQTNMDSGKIAYTRQHKALGLGHAVGCARQLIGDEPFAVMLPDDVIASERSCLKQMIEAYEETGGSMVAAMEVSPEATKSYGVLDVKASVGRVNHVAGMVEKPAAGTAPSNLAVIGRYILAPVSNLMAVAMTVAPKRVTCRRLWRLPCQTQSCVTNSRCTLMVSSTRRWRRSNLCSQTRGKPTDCGLDANGFCYGLGANAISLEMSFLYRG